MKKCKKTGFKDKKQAEHGLHAIINTKDGRNKPVRAHQCDRCGKWHLTSKPIDNDLHTNYKLKLDWSKLINQ